jgi:hypothetical protein
VFDAGASVVGVGVGEMECNGEEKGKASGKKEERREK